ncbi:MULTISPECIES: hypothetical protein [unclassified Mycolicibacterium]|uniref:hypothetical protein n=1 Tax=unclassified Mycolicibacterium TaxID=2636767 RepID=UPI002ED88DFA
MFAVDFSALGNPWVLVPAAVAIMVLPAIVYVDYTTRLALRAMRIPRGRRLGEFWRLLGMTGQQLMVIAQPSEPPPAADGHGASALHESFLEGEARTFESMLICGSIGFAGWSLLFVSSDLPVVKQLSGLTMGFLFTGSAWLLAGPLIWRTSGAYSTSLGRDSALRIGFSLIVISLASIVIDLRIPIAMAIAVIVVYLIVMREGSQAVAMIGLHRTCLSR